MTISSTHRASSTRRRSIADTPEEVIMGKKDETPEQRAARKAKGTSHRIVARRSAFASAAGFCFMVYD